MVLSPAYDRAVRLDAAAMKALPRTDGNEGATGWRSLTYVLAFKSVIGTPTYN